MWIFSGEAGCAVLGFLVFPLSLPILVLFDRISRMRRRSSASKKMSRAQQGIRRNTHGK